MSNLCYECSQDGVFWIVSIVFVYKKIRCANKTKIKYGLNRNIIIKYKYKHNKIQAKNYH